MEWLAGRIMLLSGGSRACVAIAAGLVAVLALPPFGIFAAPFLSFPILVWLIDGASEVHRMVLARHHARLGNDFWRWGSEQKR